MLRLYAVSDGPPSLAVRMALKALNLNYNHISVDYGKGEHLLDEYAEKNPQKEIPVLDDNGFYLSESNAILQYLIDQYAEDGQLYPKEPKARAIVNQRLCFNASFYYNRISDHVMAPIFFDYKRTPLSLKKVHIALDVFETYLKRLGTKYVAGDHLTIADFQLITATMCLEAIDFDFKNYPLINKWYSTFKEEYPELWAITEAGMKEIADFEKNPPDLSELNHPIHPVRKVVVCNKMEAKVGIQINDKNVLFKINKEKSLEENIQEICRKNDLISGDAYGLIFSYTLDRTNENRYVTEDNFQYIQNGFTLKLVENLDKLIDRVFLNIIDQNNKTQHFKELISLSTDPGFIKLLVTKNLEIQIFKWISTENLQGEELSACLSILLHLLKKQCLKEVPIIVIQNVINIIKVNFLSAAAVHIQYALAVLCQILYLKGHDVNKHAIVTSLEMKDIVPFIGNSENVNLQLNTMMLVNALVKCVKGERRSYFIKDLNRSKNREYIFSHIIRYMKRDSAMAHELYTYQTYILSLYGVSLNSYLNTIENPMLEKLELCEAKINRLSTYIDFDEICRNRSNSTGTILEDLDNARISFASTGSDISIPTKRTSNGPEDNQISVLTYEALTHYKKYHYKNFTQSYIEENTYEPGIFYTSEKVTRLLANILHVGMEPTRIGQSYHPLVFNTSLKIPFFLELFSRTMWLLSKTRREMRAWTFNDYSKIFLVLEKQIKMSLDRRPMNYKTLTKEMMKMNYEEIDKQWQIEKQQEWKDIYEKNPNVQLLKGIFLVNNEILIYENRMRVLQNGGLFPKLPERVLWQKAKHQQFFFRLSDNRRMIIWGDWDDTIYDFKEDEPKRFNISNIQHFVIGKACPHIKNQSVKDSGRAFSIILDEGAYINFFAKDVKTADLWIDGFNLLLGNIHRSNEYKNDLSTLLEMDCALHLLELQNIPIPNSAPIVPPLPSCIRLKPNVPPKSPNVKLRKMVAPSNTQTIKK
ncbi:hypothetical protein FQA39_LY09759 [Lamprigera yunnana]|nr:hypothetical protein FQA39_LY09759 [Lamprigera yunnana]